MEAISESGFADVCFLEHTYTERDLVMCFMWAPKT
jgi:hypothetical protein